MTNGLTRLLNWTNNTNIMAKFMKKNKPHKVKLLAAMVWCYKTSKTSATVVMSFELNHGFITTLTLDAKFTEKANNN